MKKGLLLCGYACKPWIWDGVKDRLEKEYDIDIIEWPNELIGTFNKVEDFAEWTINNYSVVNTKIDFIVGHSMGGVIALYIAASKKVKVNKVVLVESFIRSPDKFFQNLVYDEANKDLILKITDMIKNEAQYYSSEIGNELSCLNVAELAYNLDCDIYAIYGDRGCGNKERVISELAFNQEVNRKVEVDIISNSCHFPMLENENEVVEYLNRTL